MTCPAPSDRLVIADTDELYIERRINPKARFSLLDDMIVEQGTKADWDALHDFHYKAETLPIGPTFWRCVTSAGELVGVVVLCYPTLLLAPRHTLFPKLKPTGTDTKFTNSYRARWLNNNFRRAARIVNDTLYRGTGSGYRMVNLVMRLSGIRFIEIQSSMSKFNPFDAKAGFVHAKLVPGAAYQKGLEWFRRYFESHPADFAAVMDEYDAMPETVQARVLESMREMYFRHSAKEKTGGDGVDLIKKGRERVSHMGPQAILKELQQLVFSTPVYGIWENPDVGRKLPPRLPLRAFDLQGPNEPLRLDLLEDLGFVPDQKTD